MKPKEQVKELLEQGKSRAEILKELQKNAENCKSCRQIDTYIADAKNEIEAEQAGTKAEILAARKFRDIEAAKLIPTNAELIAMLCRKIDFDNPVPTGYELKPIDGIFQNVPRFASETFYLTAIAKIIDYNNNLAASTNTNENTIQAVLVINTSERLIENEEDLSE
jgi:hypothetical protein